MIYTLTKLITKTPFYPHWLDTYNYTRGKRKTYKYFKGKVIETGAGNCEVKKELISNIPAIKNYVATDYSEWDGLFKDQKKAINSLGAITKGLYGAKQKDNSKIDAVCDAMDLPFKRNSFDVYCSFATLEHISHPIKFFEEAHRVLKKGGICITAQPFLYREHGGKDFDFQRFTRGGYRVLAKDTGFKLVDIYTFSYFGTTLSVLINQYVIRKILEGSMVLKIVLLLLSPLLFFTTNIIGLIIDHIDHDIRFAQRYFVIMKKV